MNKIEHTELLLWWLSILLVLFDRAGVEGGVASPPRLVGSSPSSSCTNCCNSPNPELSFILVI